MKPSQHRRRAFTLVELLVVIAIIGLLSTVALVSLDASRKKARDTKRLADMRQTLTALELYRELNGVYPANTDTDPSCGGWDVGYFGGPGSGDQFIQPLKDSGLINTPGDPLGGNCDDVGYKYYLYPAGGYNCDASRGDFFVLGILDMETWDWEHTGVQYPSSPGWTCSARDWNVEFEWVTGGYTNS